MKSGPELVLDVRSAILTREDEAEKFRLEIPELGLKPGTCVALTAPSGGGKTTCLELLALLVQPDEIGHFFLSGIGDLTDKLRAGQLDKLAHLRSGPIGFGAQTGGLLPFLTAREDAGAPLILSGQGPRADLIDRFEAIARHLQLLSVLKRRRDALSGGERKRVSLLRAMAVPRRLLLLDEPTSGLDADMAKKVMELIAELCAFDGTACIVATHAPELALAAGFEHHRLKTSLGQASIEISPTKSLSSVFQDTGS